MESTIVADSGRSALLSAVGWVGSLMLGSIGTAFAVIAIALTGFAMLQGRFSAREGLRSVLGCFILFGAPIIARGIAEASQSSVGMPANTGQQAPPPAPPLPSQPPQFDPYAGASTPM